MEAEIRHNWSVEQVKTLFALPFNDLLFQAQSIHRQHFNPNEVQVSTLLSIKTGACPEDCKYCPQSARYQTGLESERLLEVEKVLERAKEAKAAGSSRFCMGATDKAYPGPADYAKLRPYKNEMSLRLKLLWLLKSLCLQQFAFRLQVLSHNVLTESSIYSLQDIFLF
jgi:biotin synthase